MAGLADLVGALMQGGMSSSGNQRIGNALGQGGLGDLLGSLTSGAGGGSGGGSNDLLGGLAKAAGDLFGSAGQAVKDGNPAAVGGLGALAGALFGGGGGAIKGALGGSAMALLAGLAVKALGGNQGGETQGVVGAAPLGLRTPTSADEERELEHNAELLLKAMISAAKADGQIDNAEIERILGRLREAGADDEIQAMVLGQMRAPLDLEALVAEIPSPQVAAEVYAASLFAIEVDTPAEREYLARLAAGTGLDAAAVQQLHTALGVR
jgi:uncharacterized membrane protein YebE (DUF533 family)